MSVSEPTCAEGVWLTAGEIAQRVSTGELTAAEVLDAHIARCGAVDARLNSVVVPRFEQARAAAVAIDRARAAGLPLGPLAGVPVTIKDCFQVAGTAATLGIARNGEVAGEDGALVARLQAAGAVVLGKTNVPQLMIFFETDNPVFGRTNNPWRLDRSPGGSSGGDAAAVAAGIAPLGLGSDLGGSIRQPAHSCGIHGFKPTSDRLTGRGNLITLRGMDSIGLQPGPLARSVDDLALAMEVLVGATHDANDDVPPVAWSDYRRVSLAGLRVAMWTDDGYFSASPALRRGVVEAAAALRTAGAVVENFSPPDVREAMAIYFGLISADGGADFARLLGQNPVDWRVAHLLRVGRLPRFLRPALAHFFSARGQGRRAELLAQTGPRSAAGYWQLIDRRDRYVDRFMGALAAERFDAMICPPFALPALRHGSSLRLIAAGSYCMMPSLLGIPAGTVAATRVRPGEESDRQASRDPSDLAAIAAERDSAGLPVGVQVAAGHWRDDVVLAIMKTLETHFTSQPDYPKLPPA